MNINIREATLDDVEAIDALQKMSTHELGFLPTGALKGYVQDPTRDVLVAEEVRGQEEAEDSSSLTSDLRPLISGYIIGRDSYYSNEKCGYITQLNVHPDYRRYLVGAKLVEAIFERAAYGCKLFACWCAQDLPANTFWESIGFVPIAFRTGSEKKERIHIFWQKRIRECDSETSYWFPSRTRGGQIGSDRVAVPIPPGTHWSDAKPMILPGVSEVPMFIEGAASEEERKLLEDANVSAKQAKEKEKNAKARAEKIKTTASPGSGTGAPVSGRKGRRKRRLVSEGGLRYPTPQEQAAEAAAAKAAAECDAAKQARKDARKKAKKAEKRKYHPEFLKAAREFRDRFLESAESADGENLLAAPESACKYDVSREIEGGLGLEGLSDKNALPASGALTADCASGKKNVSRNTHEDDDDARDIIDAESTAHQADEDGRAAA